MPWPGLPVRRTMGAWVSTTRTRATSSNRRGRRSFIRRGCLAAHGRIWAQDTRVCVWLRPWQLPGVTPACRRADDEHGGRHDAVSSAVLGEVGQGGPQYALESGGRVLDGEYRCCRVPARSYQQLAALGHVRDVHEDHQRALEPAESGPVDEAAGVIGGYVPGHDGHFLGHALLGYRNSGERRCSRRTAHSRHDGHRHARLGAGGHFLEATTEQVRVIALESDHEPSCHGAVLHDLVDVFLGSGRARPAARVLSRGFSGSGSPPPSGCW